MKRKIKLSRSDGVIDIVVWDWLKKCREALKSY